MDRYYNLGDTILFKNMFLGDGIRDDGINGVTGVIVEILERLGPDRYFVGVLIGDEVKTWVSNNLTESNLDVVKITDNLTKLSVPKHYMK